MLFSRLRRVMDSAAGKDGTGYTPVYGDVTKLNRERTILNALSDETLHSILNELTALMGTSCAVYEKNGDYAAGIFTSGWCRALDEASFRRCGTSDVAEALKCGQWLCHESCWTDASRIAIETGAPVDRECRGGLRLYALPIQHKGEVLGAINFGYGDPPSDVEKLRKISADYGLSLEALQEAAAAYESRPSFVVELARKRLEVAARFIALIVERTQAEKRLLEAKVSAETANEAKGFFLANASHELRTPLNAVVGFLDLALSSELPPQVRSFLANAEESAQSLQELINELLDLSRAEAGKVPLEAIPFDVRALLGQVFRTVTLAAYEKGVELLSDVAPDVPLRLVGDEHRMRQILTNLVSNAVKFTDQGSVEVRVGMAASAEGRVTLNFSVEDTGIGIAPAEQKHIFLPFVQATTSRARRSGGTGLGLPIAAALVRLMGGGISLESEPGVGSRFAFTVHLALEAARAPSFEPLLPEPSGKPVIILGGNERAQRYLTSLLGEWGFRDLTCSCLEEGLDLPGASFPAPGALVIVDLSGDEAGQAEALEQVAAFLGCSARPLFLLSPLARSRPSHPLLDASTLLVKPLSRETLRAAIRQALDARASCACSSEVC